MKARIVYYELYSDATKTLTTQNCIAVLSHKRAQDSKHPKVVAYAPEFWQAFRETNAPVYERELLCTFLLAYCVRIPEKKASNLHPRLVEEVCTSIERVGEDQTNTFQKVQKGMWRKLHQTLALFSSPRSNNGSLEHTDKVVALSAQKQNLR